MLPSAVLVPRPFYAPVPVDTGPLRKFGQPARPPRLRQPPARIPLPDVEPGMAYDRDGRLVADDLLGTIVDLYA